MVSELFLAFDRYFNKLWSSLAVSLEENFLKSAKRLHLMRNIIFCNSDISPSIHGLALSFIQYLFYLNKNTLFDYYTTSKRLSA